MKQKVIRSKDWMLPVYVKFYAKAIKRGRELIIYGGAGSGKSYSVAEYFLVLIGYSAEPLRILVTRKTNPALKLTAYELVKEILDKNKIIYLENKSEQIIALMDGTKIYFRGMDDPEKIKSAEFNIIWLEEATEFTEKDYQQLKLRLRRPPVKSRKGWIIPNQIILTFNPISIHNWVYKFFFEKKNTEAMILHTTYKDNPFLDEEYRRQLEELIKQDKTYYEIYTLGKFAEPLNVIYTNYQIVSEVPDSFDEIIYGLDFGYNNPSALVKIGIKDGEYWILDELYETKLTNADLIEKLKEKVDPKSAPIYCDSAEPNRIEEISRAGFYAYPSDKSVKDGIDFVKRQKLYIHEGCVNMIKEIQNYKWREDKDGNVLDEPVKFMDHLCDAMRYAIYTHNKNMTGEVRIRFV